MGCGGSKPEDDAGDKADERVSVKLTDSEELDIDTSGPLSADDLKARIIGSSKAEEFELGSSGFTLRYAAISQRGYYPEDLYKANQDRFIVCKALNGKPNEMLLGVFDGHGTEGDGASEFVKTHIEKELKFQMNKEKYKYNFKQAYMETFRSLDNQMHEAESFDDTYSGTTAITAYFKGGDMTVANIGDSRAILGERHGKRVVAYALSVDQTPYRKDERDRVKACGARIMTMGMAHGEVKYYDGWEEKITEMDENAEPPRLFHGTSLQPGNAFTRSLGDSGSIKIGVVAEAELLQKQLREQDQFIVLASDGVWEFLSSQAVCTSVMSFTDPVAACRSIIAQAYALWLQFDVRTDDITMILAYIDTAEGQAPRPASEAEIASYEAAQHIQGSAAGLDADSTADAGGAKPVRRGLTEEKRKQMGMASTDEEAEWDTDVGDWKLEVIHKSEAEIKRIKAALKGNFLFQNLPATQTKQIYDAMKKRTVKAKDVVIKQGEKGEEFFVLDEGELAVSILNNSVEVEIMRYRPNPAGANPCFGELALMYSKPRAATVTALTDGVLWAIDRRSFREILKKSSKDKYLMRTLRSVEVLKSLSVSQLQRLGEAMEEAEFKGGESILSQGDYGDSFYIIAQGSARVVKEVDGEYKHVGTITEGQYFGERALLKEEPRAASVVAEEGGKPLKCLFISKQVFEEVLGSLQEIINKEAIHRSKVAFVKQLKKKAAGLNNAKIEDFVLQGEITNAPPTRYVLAQHRAKNYTIRATSKKQVVELGLKQRLRDEMRLLTIMQGDKKHVPIALQTMEDDSYIYSIYPTRTACLLSTLLEDEDEGHFTEPVAMFYTACLVEALEHLHNEAQSTGGVIYRNLCPSGISINESGYPQLLDMRFATIAEPPPRDYCGFAHYLSPEQVSGLGHALPSDFWQLGVLVYEMVTAGNPWLTGDPAKDSEVAVFNRITSHKAGEIRFPDGIELSSGLIKLINGLMEPNVAKRLGSKNEQMAAGYAFQQIREHEWFKENFKDPRSGEPNFAKLHAGTLVSPHKSSAEQYISACIAQNSNARQSSVRDNYFDEVYEGEDDFEGVAPTAPTYGRRASKNIAEVVMEAARKKQRKAELEKKKETRMQRAEKRMKGGEGAGEEGAGEEGASQLSMKEQNARLSVRPREADGAGKSDDDPNFTLGLDSANYKPNVRSEVATIQTNSRASSADALIDGGGDADESASKPEKSDDKNWVKRLSKGAADLANELAGLTTPKQNAPQGAAAPISTTTVPAAKPNLSA